ncbi:MAG: translation initiation factor IF-2 N-terminal domain-containing protein, partial [Longimicrobiales bacterium]
MRVYEVAKEFKVDPEKMMTLLRGLGVRVVSEASAVDDATVAKLRARLERERRAGHNDVEESLEAVIEATQPAATKTRRRKKEDLPPEPEPVAEATAGLFIDDDVKSPRAADAVEGSAAAAAVAAWAKGDS